MKISPAGERGHLVDVPGLDPAAVAERLREVAARQQIVLVDVVPGFSTVLVVLAKPIRVEDLRALLNEAAPTPASSSHPSSAGKTPNNRTPNSRTPNSRTVDGETVVVDVRYDGPDLDEVAELAGLRVDQVVELHTGTDFRAAFSGFAPGFVYLTGLPEQLQVPRRPEPRASVPSGSVALADQFTAVYPRPSPGGWRLIGTTTLPLWNAQSDPPALIRPGMTVRFRRIE